MASAVGRVTGQEAAGKGSTVEWEGRSRGADTLVVRMGMRRLPLIVERRLKAGRGPEAPVAVVCRGSLPDQVTLVSVLSRVVEEVLHDGLQAPAVIVVGEVVRLRAELRRADEPLD